MNYLQAIWQQCHYELPSKISSGYSWQGVNLIVFMVGARNCEAIQRNEILPLDLLMHADPERKPW